MEVDKIHSLGKLQVVYYRRPAFYPHLSLYLDIPVQSTRKFQIKLVYIINLLIVLLQSHSHGISITLKFLCQSISYVDFNKIFLYYY